MKKFLNQLFSEAGTASFSRVGTFLALVCSCSWVSTIVWRTSTLPSLEGLTFFIASLYALGKAGETVQRISRRGTGVPPSATARTEARG